jgi:hypothetical protein
MKRILKLVLTLCLLVVVGGVWGQDITPAQDSLLQYFVNNQSDLKSALKNYQSVSFNWQQLLLTLAGFLFFGGLTWKLWGQEWIKNHIKTKAQEAVESMANLKGTKILVLTSASGSDDFLRDFFKVKNFSNLRFEHIGDAYQAVSDFDYEMIFANNDDGKLNQDIVRQHFRTDNILFYFGKERWDTGKDNPELSRCLNMANSRAQIYGNLMSSLEFLELVKPKIKNV